MKTMSVVNPPSLIDTAYEDYCRRAEAGLPVDMSAFLGEYPAIRSTLGRLLDLHVGLEQNILEEQAAIHWPNVGDTVKGLHLVRQLGVGAFSRVFLAIEPALGNRQVAVKFTSQAATEAFILGRIDHPNITQILFVAYDEDSHLSIIAMPYRGSATLTSLLDKVLESAEQPTDAEIIGRAARDSLAVPQRDAIVGDAFVGDFEQGIRRLFAKICDAVERLHEMEILHRDLKPSNILLRPDGAPLLLDFNLADDPSAPDSRFGGTYLYMAPEQLQAIDRRLTGEPDGLGSRSDLFSIGVMLWETATGRHPFGPFPVGLAMPTVEALLEGRHSGGFLGEVPPGWKVSPDLIAIARRCLAIDPNDRPSSAAELRDLLLPPPPPPKKAKSTKWGFGVVAACLTLWFGGIAFNAPSPPMLRAEAEAALRASDFAKAEERFGSLIKADSRDARGWFGRGLARLNRAGTEPGFDIFTQGNQKRIGDFVAQPQGKRLKASLVAALADVQTAEEMVPTPEAKLLKAYLSQLMGQAHSEKLYEECLTETPNKAAQNNLAVLYLKRGETAKALGLLDAAIAKDPRFQIAYFNRAMLHLQLSVRRDGMDHRRKCLENLGLAIKVGPKRGELHLQMAVALCLPPMPRNETEDTVLEHLEQAVKIGVDLDGLRRDPIWADLRAAPRFQQLLANGSDAPPAEALPRIVHPLAE